MSISAIQWLLAVSILCSAICVLVLLRNHFDEQHLYRLHLSSEYPVCKLSRRIHGHYNRQNMSQRTQPDYLNGGRWWTSGIGKCACDQSYAHVTAVLHKKGKRSLPHHKASSSTRYLHPQGHTNPPFPPQTSLPVYIIYFSSKYPIQSKSLVV